MVGLHPSVGCCRISGNPVCIQHLLGWYFTSRNGALVQDLKTELSQLPSLAAGQALDPVLVVNKGGGVGVTQRFHTTFEPTQIIRVYAQALNDAGWKRVDERVRDTRRIEVRYCRADRSLSVHTFHTGHGSGYGLGLFRSDSSRPCP